jgi:predicted transcriptional regulator
MARIRRLHDVKPRSDLDRWFFLITFFAGAGGGTAMKLLDFPALITATYAAGVLLAYALATFATGRIKLDPEAVGDNCYYLGFLFTLASLAATLYQVAAPGPGQAQVDALPGVISGFGVALSSTIFGVFLRVFLIQMRPDFVAAENEIRAELGVATRDFRTQLSSATRDIKAFAVQSIQHASERDARLRESTEQLIKDSHEQLKKAQASLFEEFRNASFSFKEVQEAHLAEHMKFSKQAIEETSKQIAASFDATMKSLSDPLKGVQERLDTLGQHVGGLDHRVLATAENMTSFVHEFSSLRSEIDRILKTLDHAVGESDAEMRKFAAGLSRATTRIEKKTLPALEALEDRLSGQLRLVDSDDDWVGGSQAESPADVKTAKPNQAAVGGAGPWDK